MKYSLANKKIITRGEHWIAPGAHVIGDVILGHDVSIWFNSIVRGDNDTITIGDNSQVQDGCVLHTDPGFPMVLGKGVSIGHMSMIHGCTIGDGTLIGINSVVLNGARIGSGTLVGANSLIPEGKEIPGGVLVMGSPGKVIRDLTAEERVRVLEASQSYVERSGLFRRELREQALPASAR